MMANGTCPVGKREYYHLVYCLQLPESCFIHCWKETPPNSFHGMSLKLFGHADIVEMEKWTGCRRQLQSRFRKMALWTSTVKNDRINSI